MQRRLPVRTRIDIHASATRGNGSLGVVLVERIDAVRNGVCAGYAMRGV